MGKSGRLLFSSCLRRRTGCVLAQNWLCVNAAAAGLQKRTEVMERWQHQEVQVEGNRWAEEISQRWKQRKGEDRAEMKKEAKLLRCTLLNGSAWSTERKYMRRYKVEEQFNKEATEGLRFAANASRITEETTGSEDRKHTSGGVLWHSTATWEQLWAQKKERLSRSQEMKGESTKHG